MKKQFALLICGLLFVGCLSGCNAAVSQGNILPQETSTSQSNDISSQTADPSTPALAAVAENGEDYREIS